MLFRQEDEGASCRECDLRSQTRSLSHMTDFFNAAEITSCLATRRRARRPHGPDNLHRAIRVSSDCHRTLPKKNRPRPLRPCEPTTIKSGYHSSANFRISALASPSLTLVATRKPAVSSTFAL